MMRSLAGLATGLLCVQAVAVPTFAASGPPTVKVALVDMTSGTDGPTSGGRMAIRVDHRSIKAGPVHFLVTNRSRGLPHEMLVIAVNDPKAPLPYDSAKARVIEDRVKVLVDSEDLKPKTSRALDVTLAPGTYLLICNVAGHYAAGMATPLTVVP
jgi:uncharacterized cupredoxin-like copper-binding protein